MILGGVPISVTMPPRIVAKLSGISDSPGARPSIFNDDEEFALLTRHDELLLQMLYDPRLTPGLTADAARPTVRKLAAEATGEDI